jgi:hypothetical protein
MNKHEPTVSSSTDDPAVDIAAEADDIAGWPQLSQLELDVCLAGEHKQPGVVLSANRGPSADELGQARPTA